MTTPQHNIETGFGPRSTAADVVQGIDLTGRLAIVTGGYSGIGTETTRALLTVCGSDYGAAVPRASLVAACGDRRGALSRRLPG